jgi:hypothetical protein
LCFFRSQIMPASLRPWTAALLHRDKYIASLQPGSETSRTRHYASHCDLELILHLVLLKSSDLCLANKKAQQRWAFYLAERERLRLHIPVRATAWLAARSKIAPCNFVELESSHPFPAA